MGNHIERTPMALLSNRVSIPTSPLTGDPAITVSLGILKNFSELWFPSLENKNDISVY